MSKIGKHAFISYLRDYSKDALALCDSLENGFVDRAEFIPPDKLCLRGQILTPAETLELIQNMAFYIKRADTFVMLRTSGYHDNYFAQLEMIQWMGFEKPPNIYEVKIIETDINKSFEISQVYEMPISNVPRDKKSLAMNTWTRQWDGSLDDSIIWGRYANKCYFIPCHGCKKFFLASKGAVDESIKGRFDIKCICGETNRLKKDDVHRAIVTENYVSGAVISSGFLYSFKYLDKKPDDLHLVSLPGETITSEYYDFLKTSGKVILGLGAIVAAIALLNNRK